MSGGGIDVTQTDIAPALGASSSHMLKDELLNTQTITQLSGNMLTISLLLWLVKYFMKRDARWEKVVRLNSKAMMMIADALMTPNALNHAQMRKAMAASDNLEEIEEE